MLAGRAQPHSAEARRLAGPTGDGSIDNIGALPLHGMSHTVVALLPRDRGGSTLTADPF
jgi:hypothetical protein